MNKGFSQRGQFFSPDLIIATIVFLFGLAYFWSTSNSIFLQSEVFSERKLADETIHSVLNSLVYSPGNPSNWINYSLSDINSFGLAGSPNFIDKEKTITLINQLNSEDYSLVKEKLGFGVNDFQLRLLDSNGVIVSDGISLVGGRIAVNPRLSLVYQRLVFYNNGAVVLQGTISRGE